MAMFFGTTTQLGFLNTAVLAMFIFGPGLAPLPQATPGAPSTCDAPYTFYERVALLHHLFVGMELASCLLGCHARRMVTAPGGEGGLHAMGAGSRLQARACMLLAAIFSAAAAAFALTIYTYILQIKYVVFACMPSGVRAAVFSVDVVIAVAGTYVYGHMLRAVLFAD